jgi:hypothetical protein|tara:strand:- start:23 stop:235 length:213 start_codon:yes stop_codon:yes gene_type:complete
METIYWETEEELNENSFVMADYLENINMLDIVFLDGTYAEGVNCNGEKFEIHASGNGDFFNHKIEFVKIN